MSPQAASSELVALERAGQHTLGVETVVPLAPEVLRRRCDAGGFTFASTAELSPAAEALGQARAAEALHFATAMARDGYNAFVAGPTGLGKHRMVRLWLEATAKQAPPPSDWVYVFNFAAPQKPMALELPAGRAEKLKQAAADFLEKLKALLPAAFEAEDYRGQHRALDKELEEEKERRFVAFREQSEAKGVTLARTPTGFMLAPMKDGKVLSPDEFHALEPTLHAKLHEELERQGEKLRQLMDGMPVLDREHVEKLSELNRSVASRIVGHLAADLRAAFGDLPKVLEHVEAMQKDILDNLATLTAGDDEVPGPMRKLLASEPPWERYEVNVLVSRAGQTGAPVVFEDLPTQPRLVGRVDHRQIFGALITDFTMVHAGALHRANGGYLVLDAVRLLSQPFAWEALKRVLRAKRVEITTVPELVGLSSTTTLEPEPVPLEVKVVLLGERQVYYLLAKLDPEFLDHFKVLADFEEEVERTGATELAYAQLAASLCGEAGLLPLDREGTARFVDYGSRLASDQQKLSLGTAALADALREADHWAREGKRERISAADLQRAIDAKEHRSDRVRARIQEAIRRGTLLIDPGGRKVGQVHGLTVLQLADFTFGWPVRITARARVGKGQVLDVERETELGGPIHSKGVLGLTGFLTSRYATELPFSVTASVVFEQSYGAVEGDSASAAELFALLSALSGLPFSQGIAVTGSVNQHGIIQPIGAVNEKIEGYFDVCRERGLTGAEGVVIPRANLQHLMLREDVVQAVAAKQFNVWAIETVDQGLALLTGKPAGERGAGGRFPADTVNGLVEAKLRTFAEHARAFAKPPPQAH